MDPYIDQSITANLDRKTSKDKHLCPKDFIVSTSKLTTSLISKQNESTSLRNHESKLLRSTLTL